MHVSSANSLSLREEEQVSSPQKLEGGEGALPLVGMDASGHHIVLESGKNLLGGKARIETRSDQGKTIEGSVIQTASLPPIQIEEQLEQEIVVAHQFRDALENWMSLAPMMALLRSCDMFSLTPEFEKVAALNRGVDFRGVKMLLNDTVPPIRIATPDILISDQWSAVVPPIIPAGIKILVPKEGGGWEECMTPRRDPTPQENEAIRRNLQRAFRALYGQEKAEEKIAQGNEEVTFFEIASILEEDADGGNAEERGGEIHKVLALTEQAIDIQVEGQKEARLQADQMKEQAEQSLNSPYLDFFQLVSSSADFVARGAAALTTGSVEGVVRGALEGSEQGGRVVENFLDQKAPLAYHIPPLVILPVLVGAYVGASIGALTTLPGALKKSFQYFSVSSALAKVKTVAASFNDGANAILTLMETANQADEEVKQTLQRSFHAFSQTSSSPAKESASFQELKAKKDFLINQIDQRIEYRRKYIMELEMKISQKKKEQIVAAIPTSGPTNRTRIRL